MYLHFRRRSSYQEGPGWLNVLGSGLSRGFVYYKKGTLDSAASDKVYQLFAHGRWFSPGSPASSTTKTGRHDIAEILMKVALNTKDQNQIQLSRGQTWDPTLTATHMCACPCIWVF